MKKDVHLLYSDIVIDYLRGLKYREIKEKYNVTHGLIQYALEKTGTPTNRIKSKPRLFTKLKKREGSQWLKDRQMENTKINDTYLDNKKRLPCDSCNNIKNNNPVRIIDDKDIMEQQNEVDDFIEDDNLRYHIEITEEGVIKYEKGDE